FADGYGAKRSIAARGDQGDGRVTTGGAKNSACTTKGQISDRKKNPCRFRQGLEKVPTMFLKRYLQRKNRAEGFARPDDRRSVGVTNGVGNLASAITKGARPRGQVDIVEEVKQLRLELRFEALCDEEALADSQVYVFESGAVDLVATKCAVAPSVGSDRSTRGGVWRREGVRVHPLHTSKRGALDKAV